MPSKRILLFAMSLLVLFLPAQPLQAQELSRIYVAPTGNVLGAIFTANPGYPCHIYIKDTGNLVWVDFQVSTALLEVYSDGYLQLIEAGSSATISLSDYERLKKVDDVSLSYENGRIKKIGDMAFDYDTGQIRRFGDLSITFDDVRRIAQLGNISLSYANGRFRRIGDLRFDYDANARLQKIDGLSFSYENGTLQKMSGNIPGVSVILSTIVEFRKTLPGRSGR
jgi:hypothetical protein